MVRKRSKWRHDDDELCETTKGVVSTISYSAESNDRIIDQISSSISWLVANSEL